MREHYGLTDQGELFAKMIEGFIPLLDRIMGGFCGIALVAEKELQPNPSPNQHRVAEEK